MQILKLSSEILRQAGYSKYNVHVGSCIMYKSIFEKRGSAKLPVNIIIETPVAVCHTLKKKN